MNNIIGCRKSFAHFSVSIILKVADNNFKKFKKKYVINFHFAVAMVHLTGRCRGRCMAVESLCFTRLYSNHGPGARGPVRDAWTVAKYS
jgi:hypothetical protein